MVHFWKAWFCMREVFPTGSPPPSGKEEWLEVPDKTSTMVKALPGGKAAGMWLHSTVSSLISYLSLAPSSGLATEKWQWGQKTRVHNADLPLHVCLGYPHCYAARLLYEGIVLVPSQQAAWPSTRAFGLARLMASHSKRQWM